MKTKHTPSPWLIDKAKDLPLAIIDGTENGYGICEIGARTPENEANAKLIAAAPELLHGIRLVLQEVKRHGKIQTGSSVIDELEAAIKKATT